jgi:hypothetical protein
MEVGLVSQQQQAMSRTHAFTLAHRLQIAYQLDAPCVRCGALPGVWCETSGGNRAGDLHRDRVDLAGRPTPVTALRRYVEPHGWTMPNGGSR